MTWYRLRSLRRWSVAGAGWGAGGRGGGKGAELAVVIVVATAFFIVLSHMKGGSDRFAGQER